MCMKGYLITYKEEEDKREIVKSNHYLLGKITRVLGRLYYYPGVLDDVKFLKISNGCYFVTKTIDDKKFKVYEVTLNIELKDLTTAKEKWLEVAEKENRFVKNLM